MSRASRVMEIYKQHEEDLKKYKEGLYAKLSEELDDIDIHMFEVLNDDGTWTKECLDFTNRIVDEYRKEHGDPPLLSIEQFLGV